MQSQRGDLLYLWCCFSRPLPVITHSAQICKQLRSFCLSYTVYPGTCESILWHKSPSKPKLNQPTIILNLKPCLNCYTSHWRSEDRPKMPLYIPNMSSLSGFQFGPHKDRKEHTHKSLSGSVLKGTFTLLTPWVFLTTYEINKLYFK